MAASMIETFRSYQELLITQSQRFISRTREGESRASTGTGTARGSRWAAANALAFASLLPAMPTRSTPGLAKRSGTVDWAIAPYPPSRGPKIDPKPWTALNAPRARARAPSGARWDTSVQLATLIMAQHAPTPAWSATMSPSRGRSPSPTIPKRKNELKRTDRPTLPYNCIGRLPREETQPATRGYTAIDVT